MKRLIPILLALLLGNLWLPARPVRQMSATGEPHVLTILVEFRNIRFSMEDPAAHFSGMLNGRVQEYFTDNSCGQFRPQFDVWGPVLLDAPMADYGMDIVKDGQRIGDAAAQKALFEACQQLDDAVDFSRYDADGDGLADMILFYYAGYDQASGGPADAIWSHHSDVRTCPEACISEASFDGVHLGYYFCTAELRGSEGSVPTGIGRTIHEMGHALGLPDFYDTNGGTDGMAGGLYQFSPMCMGLYNNDGDLPPSFNCLEQILLGWMDEADLQELQEGWITLPPIREQVAGISRTATEGEYFLYEYRDAKGWDAALPAGLLVYHVDQSEREWGEVSVSTHWEEWEQYNDLNSRGDHPCFYIVPPMAPKDFNYASAFNPATLVFPGAGNVRCFQPADWENAPAGVQITCIDTKEGEIRFRVREGDGKLVSGLVLDASGGPMMGVSVSISQNGEVLATDYSGMDGLFLLALEEEVQGPFSLKASRPGFRPVSKEISLDDEHPLACEYLTLYAQRDPAASILFKYDPAFSYGYFPVNESIIGAVRFTAEELAPYAGFRLNRVCCYPYVTDTESLGPLYITVDQGDKRIWNQKVEETDLGEYLPIDVELADAGIRITEGAELYVGYGFESVGGNYPLATVYPGTEGNSFYSPFSLEQSSWEPMYLDLAGFHMDLMLRCVLEEVPAEYLAEMGYSSIQLREGPYKAGETIDFQLITPEWESIVETHASWDGTALEGETVRLTAGEHTLEVRLLYEDGREEYLCVPLQVD